ncbi:MAG: SPW repeat protein [Pseudomonadota bacterium]
MEIKVSSKPRWQDQLILLIGVWQFLTPWVYSYPIPSPLAWNAFVTGVVIAALAAFDLYKTYFWAVVLNLLVGIWVVASPWVLAGAGLAPPMRWNNVVAGVAVAVLALWEMRSDPELRSHWPGAAHP